MRCLKTSSAPPRERQPVVVTEADRQFAKQMILASGAWLKSETVDIVFSNKVDRGNNKLDMEVTIAQPAFLQHVLAPLKEMVKARQPDALWGVPTGGQAIAIELGRLLKLPVMQLRKVPTPDGEKKFDVKNVIPDIFIPKRHPRLLGIEDVARKRTNLIGALKVPEVRDNTEAVIEVWRRGYPEMLPDLGVETDCLINEQIPDIITPDHPFFVRYGHYAVKLSQKEQTG